MDQAEAELRGRIMRLNNETSNLREWLRRRRDIVKSTADKLCDAERRLAAVRQQLADHQMAQRAAEGMQCEGYWTYERTPSCQLRGFVRPDGKIELVGDGCGVEIVMMLLATLPGGGRP